MDTIDFLEDFLCGKYPVDSILKWIQIGSNKEAPACLSEQFDETHLESLRLEIALTLLNYLREQTEWILTSSQAFAQTPMKVNQPSKYEYTSPIKPRKRNDSSKKRRAQLFSEPKFQKSPEQDNILVRKIEESSDPKFQNLAERLSTPKSSGKLKLNETPVNSNPRNKNSKIRRSLDSMKDSKSPRSPMTLDAFITPQSSKQNKKNKKRTSDSHVALASPLLNVSKSPELNSLSDANLESPPLAKITDVEKQKCEKPDVWAQNAGSLDKSPVKPITISSPLKHMTSFDETSVKFIEPTREDVSEVEKLQNLALLYNLCIDMNLVPNVLVELYLVLQLLTVNETVNDVMNREPSLKKGIFTSVHNSVYFATEILDRQVHLFEFFDRVTLKFLVESSRLDTFCPKVKSTIYSFLETKKARHGSNGSHLNNEFLNSSVRFHSETDSRENFPDSQTFQDFKKQRDIFYTLWRQWKSSNDKSDNFALAVPQLLRLQENPVNMRHFAKLFMDQLLDEGLKELNSGQNIVIDENDLELLSKLEVQKDQAKYKKLQARLASMMPSQVGGPCPSPTFTRGQEFFKDFILHSTYGFIVHLKEVLANSIKSMNGTDFDLSRDELPTADITNSVLRLRILGKFLAMIEVLPFSKFGPNVPQTFIQSQTELRKTEKPMLDFKKILKEALKNRRLVITLPWVIEYCSMLDSIGAKLQYWQDVFKTLVNIYKSLSFKPNLLLREISNDVTDVEEILSPMKKISIKDVGQNSVKASNFNKFFLRLHLGWLFENPSFPRELFICNYNDISDVKQFDHNTIDGSKSLKSSILLTCCPYLGELKVVLSQFHTGFKSVKVTSLSTKSTIGTSSKFQAQKSPPIKQAHMQDALVANFFHNQPGSVKQTVDIVTERVTSNFVRILTTEVIPQDAKEVLRQIGAQIDANLEFLKNNGSDGSLVMPDTIKEDLRSQVEVFAEQSSKKINCIALKVVKEQLEEKVNPALKSLLAGDTKENVINICRSIIEERVMKHITKWTRKHLSKDYFCVEFSKEFEKILNEQTKATNILQVPLKQSAVILDIDKSKIDLDSILPICQILIQLKSETANMIIDRKPLNHTVETLSTFLKTIEISYAYEFNDAAPDDKSILDGGVKGFEHISFDWVLGLFTFYPHLMTPEVQETVISLWSGIIPNRPQLNFSLAMPPAPIVTLLSARNLHLFSQSPCAKATWDKLEAFIGRMLGYGIMLPIGLESQCFQIAKEDWPSDLLKRLGSCLTGVMESWKKRNSNKTSAMDDDDLHNFSGEFVEWFGWLFSCDDEYDNDMTDFPELSF